MSSADPSDPSPIDPASADPSTASSAADSSTDPTDAVTCRTCGGPGLDGDGVRCDRCRGAWVGELALLDLVADATLLPLGRLPWQPRPEPAGRACEQCAQPMPPVALYGVALDRCAGHGVWLDADELERVLHEAPRREARHLDGPSHVDLRPRVNGEAVATMILGDSTSHNRTERDGLLGVLFKLLD